MTTPPPDLNALPLPDLYRLLESSGLVARVLELARDEDFGLPPHRGDITSLACPDPRRTVTAGIVAREPCITSGLAAVPMLLQTFAPACLAGSLAPDGVAAGAGETLGVISGPTAELLGAERTLLNLIGRLCGVATLTSQYDHAMRCEAPGCRAKLLDTRKTTPGLRVLEKYAVRCGGGLCHRLGLHDAVLLKDNHLAGVQVAALGRFVTEVAQRAGADRPLRFVEVEVDSLAQLDALLALPPGVVGMILLDNMPPDLLREAVARRDRQGSAALLEASGGITIETIGAVAATGVDRISVGALTRHAHCIDIALDVA